MSEKRDLQLRLRIALHDLSPADDADDFAELVSAVLAFRTLGGDMDVRLAERLNADPAFVHHIANGLVTPTPRFRREAVKKMRSMAVELGVTGS